ncbi:MAG TPA: hypothetical protein VNM47_18935 [Terriglobia bacterium]|nr:hypothetical protein [Terriglobia bacterium]
MNRKAWDLLGKAELEGDYRGAIVGLREARECIEAQDKMLARASESDFARSQFVVNVVYSQSVRDDPESAAAQPL